MVSIMLIQRKNTESLLKVDAMLQPLVISQWLGSAGDIQYLDKSRDDKAAGRPEFP